MDLHALVKLVHILGAAVLFGTGAGIAFFMLWADLRGEIAGIAATARTVVVADYLFTATAVVLQPITGAWLAEDLGIPLTESWIVASLGLYVLVGLCWLPVVVLQTRMRDLAVAALAAGTPLPPAYRRAMRMWFWLGWPAFAGVVAIYALMIVKPALW